MIIFLPFNSLSLLKMQWMWLHSHPLVLREGRQAVLQERLLGLLWGNLSQLLGNDHWPHHGKWRRVSSQLHHRLPELLTQGWPWLCMVVLVVPLTLVLKFKKVWSLKYSLDYLEEVSNMWVRWLFNSFRNVLTIVFSRNRIKDCLLLALIRHV